MNFPGEQMHSRLWHQSQAQPPPSPARPPRSPQMTSFPCHGETQSFKIAKKFARSSSTQARSFHSPRATLFSSSYLSSELKTTPKRGRNLFDRTPQSPNVFMALLSPDTPTSSSDILSAMENAISAASAAASTVPSIASVSVSSASPPWCSISPTPPPPELFFSPSTSALAVQAQGWQGGNHPSPLSLPPQYKSECSSLRPNRPSAMSTPDACSFTDSSSILGMMMGTGAPSVGSLENGLAGGLSDSVAAMPDSGSSRLANISQFEGFGFDGLVEVDVNAILCSGDDPLAGF